MIEAVNQLAKITNSQLRPPVTAEDLALLKSKYKQLPESLVNLLAIADGETDSSFKSNGMIAFEAFMSATEIAREHDFVESNELGDLSHFEGCDRISKTWHTGLIPISMGYDLRCVCIDMNPGPAGKVGQILGLRPVTADLNVIADDLPSLLQKTLDIYQERSFNIEDDTCPCMTLEDFPRL